MDDLEQTRGLYIVITVNNLIEKLTISSHVHTLAISHELKRTEESWFVKQIHEYK